MAVLYNKQAARMVEEAINGNRHLRTGMARIASANIVRPDCKQWCENQLRILFNDNHKDVRSLAADCFHNLGHEPLMNYETLILAFCESKAFAENSSRLLKLLNLSVQRIPGLAAHACSRLLDQFLAG